MDKYGRALLDYTVNLEDIKGKKVYTSKGEEFGTVKGLYIDPKTLNVEIVRIGSDRVTEDFLIGRNYVQSIEKDKVKLSIVPWETIKGMDVHDSRGNKVGRVKDVHRVGTTHRIDSVVVDRGRKKDMRIQWKDLDHIGDNVNLRIPVEA
jgi:sporulation protein YlmC with PRC-barrel domain